MLVFQLDPHVTKQPVPMCPLPLGGGNAALWAGSRGEVEPSGLISGPGPDPTDLGSIVGDSLVGGTMNKGPVK